MTRKEAIRRMECCRNFLANNYSDMGEPNFTAFNMAIKALEQEPKTGYWIQTNESFINQDGQFIYNFICSECKSLSYFRKSNKKVIGANVCPNCGCRMVDPQERSKE